MISVRFFKFTFLLLLSVVKCNGFLHLSPWSNPLTMNTLTSTNQHHRRPSNKTTKFSNPTPICKRNIDEIHRGRIAVTSLGSSDSTQNTDTVQGYPKLVATFGVLSALAWIFM